MSTIARSASIRPLGALAVCLAVAAAIFATLLDMQRPGEHSDAAAAAPAAQVRPVAERGERKLSREEVGAEHAKHRFLMMLYLQSATGRDGLWSRR